MRDGSIRISVAVKPGAKDTTITSLDQELGVRVAAVAKEGEANKELLRYLAQILSTNKRSISLLRGDKSRAKIIAISGLTAVYITQQLMKNYTPNK